MKKVDRKLVYEKFGGRCAYCGCDLKKFQIDHIIPKSSFSTHVINKLRVPDFLRHLTTKDVNHPDNLVPTCPSCNNYKRSNDLELFRSEISELIHRLNKRFTQYKIAKRFNLVEETKNKVEFYFEIFLTEKMKENESK